MTTVQVAIGDAEYAQTIAALLRREERYRLLMVVEPDLTLEGIIVLDWEHLERLGGAGLTPERFVLITTKDPEKLAHLWNVGIRHVVFREDSPNTVQLAVSAAELRQLRLTPARDAIDRRAADPPRGSMQRHYRPELFHILQPQRPERCPACVLLRFSDHDFC